MSAQGTNSKGHTMPATATASMKQAAFGDLDRELAVTRTVLERLLEEHFAWKPHEKSMHLGRLAMHVATLPQWMVTTIEQEGLDFANPPQIRTEANSHADLLKEFDKQATAAREALSQMRDSDLHRPWTLR